MAFSAKLELRQSQSLVMTPQLQQAIKLLQLSNIELCQFVEAELERNPLLERDEAGDEPFSPLDDVDGQSLLASDRRLATESTSAADADGASFDAASYDDSGSEDSGADQWLAENGAGLSVVADLDTSYDNIDPDLIAGEMARLTDPGWSDRDGASAGSGSETGLDAYVSAEISLRDHLNAQMPLAINDPVQRLIAGSLIDMVDDAGYLRGDVAGLAEQLGTTERLVEDTLGILQGFDPCGVFARTLGECLAIQLREQNRYDPVIGALLDNLDLLAQHNLGALRKICGVDAEELAEMIAEIKQLSPKPGLQFGSISVQPVVPDVIVLNRSDGGWHIELNSATLPKVLVSRQYFTTVNGRARSDQDKGYLNECLQTANWLVKSLDQRARTILKVADEIVRQQDAFLTHGVQHLRPLNLKTVADAISMHESTVSRVTSNKYMATPRGLFELKYFFTSSINASGAGEAHSSEAVRFRIKALIDVEKCSNVLSDDQIVILLREQGVDIARRTVAKYREAMQIPSSVQRRRQKQMDLATARA